jgi:hypothetical protein
MMYVAAADAKVYIWNQSRDDEENKNTGSDEREEERRQDVARQVTQ